MKTRDIAILGGLVALVLIFTVAEELADRRKEERRHVESIERMQSMRDSLTAETDRRWQALSVHTRRILDSLNRDAIRYRARVESLSAASQPALHAEAEQKPPVVPDIAPPADTPQQVAASGTDVTTDSIPQHQITDVEVVAEYYRGIAALPKDLNAYEQRVANNEVESLIREKYQLSRERLSDLLKENPPKNLLSSES